MPTPAPTPEKSTVRQGNIGKWILVLLPLGWLWFHLINNLRLEWDTNPQYSYGLVVPILVVGLLLRRWVYFPARKVASAAVNPGLAVLFFSLLAFLFLPSRLVEEATPEWRPLKWLITIETVGLTLYIIYMAGGKNWLRQAAFPILFFLVAVPWPSPIETPLIQGLSRLNAHLVVEVLGIVGVPAIPHGNVIEVSTGMVGINDACSGIRSLQSSLMISLFLGEFYFFNWQRRLLLLPIGFALAMGLNLCRASLLAWVAAKDGLGAIAKYHDEAGFSIMLVCTAGLWLAGWLLSQKKSATTPAASASAAPVGTDFRRLKRFALPLLVWIVCVEIGVATWYHVRESGLKPGPSWTVNLPVEKATFKEAQPTEDEKILLQFDGAKRGNWQESDGSVWQVFYFDWRPGRVAGYLAKRHTPDICLTATGLRMSAGPTLEVMTVHGVDLPMRHYVFETADGPLQVFQCHWEAGLGKGNFTANESSRFNLIRGVWAGRGNQGQKVLEIVISGYADAAQARQKLVEQLEQLIKVQP